MGFISICIPIGRLVQNNNITGNSFGLIFMDSWDNLVFNNNFIDNVVQVNLETSNSTWDNGYPSGGNYWSDYSDTDWYKGLNQTEGGSDYIWDNPYVIDSENIDNYPLTRPQVSQV